MEIHSSSGLTYWIDGRFEAEHSVSCSLTCSMSNAHTLVTSPNKNPTYRNRRIIVAGVLEIFYALIEYYDGGLCSDDRRPDVLTVQPPTIITSGHRYNGIRDYAAAAAKKRFHNSDKRKFTKWNGDVGFGLSSRGFPWNVGKGPEFFQTCICMVMLEVWSQNYLRSQRTSRNESALISNSFTTPNTISKVTSSLSIRKSYQSTETSLLEIVTVNPPTLECSAGPYLVGRIEIASHNWGLVFEYRDEQLIGNRRVVLPQVHATVAGHVHTVPAKRQQGFLRS